LEEEIKILEEKIKQFKAYKSNVYDINFGEMMKRLILNGKEVQTLENLLTRYKQLEEENKTLKKVKSDELIINNPWLFEYLNELYIFKGKVKEKIDKINERIKYLHTEINKCVEEREKLGTETDIDNNETLIFHLEDEKEELYAKKQGLQELLREEEGRCVSIVKKEL